MTEPWADPQATGISRAWLTQDAARVIADRRGRRSALWAQQPHFDVALDVALRYGADVAVHQLDNGGEWWLLRFNHERMERMVIMWVESPSWFNGLSFELIGSASWIPPGIEDDFSVWRTYPEHRWFGVTSAAPLSLFERTLELAFDDAIAFTTDDLDPTPIGPDGQPRRGTHFDMRKSES